MSACFLIESCEPQFKDVRKLTSEGPEEAPVVEGLGPSGGVDYAFEARTVLMFE